MFTRFALAAVGMFVLLLPSLAHGNEMVRVSDESRSFIMKVYAQQGVNLYGQPKVSIGSAVLIKDKNGALRILTNRHVVGDAKTAWVQFRGVFAQKVSVLGTDPRADLALLDGPKTLPSFARPIDFASTTAQIGDVVYAIGYPLGGYNISYGWVTSLVAPVGLRTMTHQAPLTHGNSGGALIRLNDKKVPELIGINTAISGDDGNMSYFVPVSVAQRLLPKLEKGTVVHAMMGVGLVDTVEIDPINYPRISGLPYPPTRLGILITSVIPGSSAAQAGVRPGDLIVKCEALIDGSWKPLPSGTSADLSDEVFFDIEPGTRGRLTILRGSERLHFELTFVAAPPI